MNRIVLFKKYIYVFFDEVSIYLLWLFKGHFWKVILIKTEGWTNWETEKKGKHILDCNKEKQLYK